MNIYGFAPISGACHWYRIREPLRGLAGLGHMTEWGELFDENVVRRHDTIVTHILHGEEPCQAWRYLWEAGQHKLIFDIDDNIWAYDPETEHGAYWTRERQEQVERNIRLSHLVTTPSPVIADIIRFKLGLNEHVAILPNTIPAWVLDIPRTVPEVFTVGYQGAPQRIHQSDLDVIQEELFWFLSKCDDARLRFYGQAAPLEGAGPFANRVDYVPWTPSVPEYYRSLHGMTVGIGPLRPSAFTEAKSGIRAIEFAGLGIPGVFSDTAPYRPWVKHRETGYLVHVQTDWRKYLIKLYRNPAQVERLSQQARVAARGFTTEANAHLWADAYRRTGPGARPATSAR